MTIKVFGIRTCSYLYPDISLQLNFQTLNNTSWAIEPGIVLIPRDATLACVSLAPLQFVLEKANFAQASLKNSPKQIC